MPVHPGLIVRRRASHPGLSGRLTPRTILAGRIAAPRQAWGAGRMDLKLAGRVVVITGASRGIGHATVMQFAMAGWRILSCSRQAFSDKCPWPSGADDHVQIDLGDPEDTMRGIAEIKRRLAAEGGDALSIARDINHIVLWGWIFLAMTNGLYAMWSGMVEVLGIAAEVAAIEQARGVSFARDEGVRFAHRDALFPLVEARVAAWDRAALEAALTAKGGCFGFYGSMTAAANDP
eukprot:gene40344-54566_t